MSKLLVLQLTMLLLIITGAAIRRLGIISKEGQKNMNDLVIYLVLPCNIVKSFMITFNRELLQQFGIVFVLSIVVQVISVILGKILYGKREPSHRMNLQYSLLCSNAGFLGNPIAEGVFGAVGLAMASVFLIPMRIMMWSSGIAIYTQSADWKATVKKVVTHPCIIACFVGLILMLTQWTPPELITNTIGTIGQCNTALSMMLIGMILAQIDWKTFLDSEVLRYSVLRLLLVPLGIYLICSAFHLPKLASGVTVLLTAMPAGATTSILASKYGCDEKFATRLVVVSTVISMVTIPIWNFVLTK